MGTGGSGDLTSWYSAPYAITNPAYCPTITITYTPPQPPVASFTFAREGNSNLAPCTVQFTDTSFTFLGMDEWEWDFGDGGTSTEQSPEYTFDTAGTFLVVLTVYDPIGWDDQAFYMYVGLVIVFNSDPPLEANATQNYIYQAETNVDNASFDWSFDEGLTWIHGWDNWTWGTPGNETQDGNVSVYAYNTDGGTYQNFSIDAVAYVPPTGGSGTIIAVTSVPGSISIAVGAAYSYTVATSPSGATMALDTDADWLSLGAVNHTVYGRAPADPAVYSASIEVELTGFNTTWQNYTILVSNGTGGPSMESPFIYTGPPVEIGLGDFYDWVAWSNFDVVSWVLNTNASFISINQTTGELYGYANETGKFYIWVVGNLESGGNVSMNYTLAVVQAAADPMAEQWLLMAMIIFLLASMIIIGIVRYPIVISMAGFILIVVSLILWADISEILMIAGLGFGVFLALAGIGGTMK
jgi:PKD repeat protein